MIPTVVLYNPMPSPAPRPNVPLSLLALARMLPRDRYNIVVVNGAVERTPYRRVLEAMNGACVLGVTAMTGHQIHDAVRLVERVRRRFPRVPVVWGGYHPSLLPRETLDDPCVDYVVRGQGERAFAALVDQLVAGGNPASGIPGVTWAGGVDTPPGPGESLDTFPFLAWDLIPPAQLPLGPDGAPAVDFYTSQGCPFACAFCAEPEVYGRRRISTSPGRAVDEIEFLANRGVRSFHLRDALFFASLAWVDEFCRLLLRRDLQVSFYAANGRVDTLVRLSREQWSLLDRAGFREVLLGVESGHLPALKKIAKGVRPDQSRELLRLADHTPIRFVLTAMIGIPGVDPEEEFQDTIALLQDLVPSRPGPVSSVQLFAYLPYPGSRLYREAAALGFHPPSTLRDWARYNFDSTRYPWGSGRRRRHGRQLTQYLLPRITGRGSSRYRVVEAVYRLLDPFLRQRWETGQFDRFWEGAVFSGFDGLRRLRREVDRRR